ncbi:MAG: Hpt domain-containing protein [Gemmatimonadetes bacterium]|nr:Hpt domain-containing protein [Gemmatimonadota bacterium]
MADAQIIDPQALERLREWGGEKLAGQMVPLFLKNSGTRMDQIRAGVTGTDLQEAERGAHSLKSSAANIGAETLRTLATRMEGAALDGSVETAGALLPELESAYADAMRELATLENVGYRQLNTWWRVKGTISAIRGVQGWGKMTRKGFSGATT